MKFQVKLFVYDQFHSGNRDQEWDRIKVTCQQMFVKSRKYGLSFIVCRKDIPASRKVNQENIIKEKEKKLLKEMAAKKKVEKEEKLAKPVFQPDDFIKVSIK